MQVLGSVVNGQLGVVARIGALRRSSPEVSPQVPTLIAAEFPILAVEATLAALGLVHADRSARAALVLPLIGIAVVGTGSAGARHLALRKARELWKGLAVLRSLSGGGRVIGLVLIAVVALGQLPTGPGAGAAAAVLILGRHGVAAAAAAGVIMTATGTVGGLIFVVWGTTDHLWSARRVRRAEL